MSHRILVVEDDQQVREAICDVLADEGYEVSTAADGADALDLILIVGDKQPHLILLDLQMPTVDGGQFALQYQLMPPPRSPIIVMSGLPDLEDRANALGADGYLAKPFSLDALAGVVEHHLRPKKVPKWGGLFGTTKPVVSRWFRSV